MLKARAGDRAGDLGRIALITDFGGGGPYVGQMELRLADLAPDIPVVNLVSDLAPFRPDLAAYLLPALVHDMPAGTLYLCVVDPGVGGDRAALAMQADGDWFVGPDNGLLALVARRAREARVLQVDWRPPRLSESFHGRDLFAPIGAMLSRGEIPASRPLAPAAMVGHDWPGDLARIVYADGYGNLITGMRATGLGRERILLAHGRTVRFARTFCAVEPGAPFWYENAFGLVELAVNSGRADTALGMGPGDDVLLEA